MNVPPVAPEDELFTPAELAALWKVDVKTVVRWANAGRFPEGTILWTLGGHRRFKASKVRALMSGLTK